MRLHEHSVKQALEALSWPKLKAALDTVQFDAAVAEELAGLVLRCTRLLLKRSDPERAKKRTELFERSLQYVADRGADPAKLREAQQTIELIDRGYQGILQMLDASDVSKLAPEVRVAACIERTAIEYAEVMRRMKKAEASLPEFFDPNNPVLLGEEGITFTPDGATSLLVETLTMSLIMESYPTKWIAGKDDDRIVLPKWQSANDKQRYMAGSTGMLAAFWRIWQRIEERRRYFGGTLNEYAPPARPPWLEPDFPQDATVVALEPEMDWEAVDFVANERVNAVLFQNYMRLLTMTNALDKEAGIEGTVPLLPDAFVCVAEAHAAWALSDLLAFAVHEDEGRYAGLRLLEWLRGFAVLQCMADRAWDKSGGKWQSLVQFLKRSDLRAALERLGLSPQAAQEFIKLATLRRSSRDLYDCPLIAVGDEDLILFGPAVRSANLTRVILSAISSLGVQISRKGPAFERRLQGLLEKQGLTCKAFKFKRDGEEYEYDAVLQWGKYIFVFECKSESLSSLSPAASYYFRLGITSHISQVKRLSEALRRYPDILEAHFGEAAKDKEIVPCVVSAMPFSLPGASDGVYFTDMSALTRFFEDRHLRVIRPHNLEGGHRILHRVALKSLWAGDRPTPDDLMRQLEDPIQIKMISERLAIEYQWTRIADRGVAVHPRIVLQPDTVDAAVARFGANPKRVREEMDLLSAEIAKRRLGSKKAKKKRKKK